MRKHTLNIWTFILGVALPPVFGVLFVGIFEASDYSIIFYPLVLVVGYMIALIPSALFCYFLYLFANYLTQRDKIIHTYLFWFLRLSFAGMVMALLFPILMGIIGLLGVKAPLSKTLDFWLAPSLSTGFTIGAILSPLWYFYNKSAQQGRSGDSQGRAVS